ncbi:MAG: OmpA family protein [Flavobacteriales bacterium]|nr:OmpA family protein [Flavobacteriales bacterium]
MKKGLLLITALAFLGAPSFGQDKKEAKKQEKEAKQKSGKVKFNKFSIGGHGGHTIFYGDVRQYDWWLTDNAEERWNFAGGGYVAYQISPVFGANINVMGGTLGGVRRLAVNSPAGNSSIPPTQFTNVKFKNHFIDYTLNFTFNWVNLLYSDRTKERRVTSYLTGGIGFISFRSLKTGLYNDEFVNSVGYINQGTENHKNRTTETIFPLGIGVKFRLSRRFDLGLEYTHRFTFSDKLDATVGNTGVNDSYSYASMFLAFKFGKNKTSEEWVNPFQSLNKKLDDIETNLEGLAVDSDGDGVSDLFDKEPSTPADLAVDGSGRALDTDGDGVPDYLDSDPFTSKGARVDESGRELDSDADGVADSQDLEPNTPAGNLVNFQGKTIDLKAKDGESKSTVASGGTLLSIYFKVNSSRIDYWSSYDKLAEVAKVLKTNSGVKVNVVGHADKTGAEDYNKSLAEKRAQAAVDHLVKVYGIDAGRLTVVSEGFSKPLSQTDDALNVNRRVDFVVQ